MISFYVTDVYVRTFETFKIVDGCSNSYESVLYLGGCFILGNEF